jgi:hypothetical protein
MSNKPNYPTKVNETREYTDYEICHELPSYDDSASDSVANEHSIVVRFSYDHENRTAFGVVTHEVNGQHDELGTLTLTNTQFHRITGHPVAAVDKLELLSRVNGQVTIYEGVATLPDGTTINL